MPKGTIRNCAFTGIQFRPANEREVLAPETRRLICEAIADRFSTDVVFRKEVITAILQDAETAKQLVSSMFAVKAIDIGLTTSGSIADLFCKKTKPSGDKKAPKSS